MFLSTFVIFLFQNRGSITRDNNHKRICCATSSLTLLATINTVYSLSVCSIKTLAGLTIAAYKANEQIRLFCVGFSKTLSAAVKLCLVTKNELSSVDFVTFVNGHQQTKSASITKAGDEYTCTAIISTANAEGVGFSIACDISHLHVAYFEICAE